MIELAPKTTDKFDVYEAELYIWTCTHNNKYDWRFPTKGEAAEFIITGSWDAWDFKHYRIEQMAITNYHWKVTPVRDKDD